MPLIDALADLSTFAPICFSKGPFKIRDTKYMSTKEVCVWGGKDNHVSVNITQSDGNMTNSRDRKVGSSSLS